jgi:hypothetical protein
MRRSPRSSGRSRFRTRQSSSAASSRLEFVVTPEVRKTGIGHVDPARLTKHIDIVTDGFQLPRKLPPEMVFDSSFLPPAAERQIAN